MEIIFLKIFENFFHVDNVENLMLKAVEIVENAISFFMLLQDF